MMSAHGPKRGGDATGDRRACGGCGATLARDNTGHLCSRCLREQRDQFRTPPHHPDEFWNTDAFRAAFKSRHIGRVFKVYRNHPRHRQIHGKALNQGTLGRWLNLEQSQVSRIENSPEPEWNIKIVEGYAETLHIPPHLLWFDPTDESRSRAQSRPRSQESNTNGLIVVDSSNSTELLRVNLTETLSPVLSDAGMDDWEQRIHSLGRATRYRAAGHLMPDLTNDISDLRKLLSQSRSFKLSQRLTRALAQLSGLTSLTLLKLGDRTGSRNWVGTARTLAAETGDKDLQSWVCAQEAYFHFYDRNLTSAIESARHAEDLTQNSASVGSVLAAALEARAHALQGDNSQTFAAVGRAESYLEHLDPSLTESSAFGYDEAQLRFHQGSALTQLGSTKAALVAQDQALELYSEQNYLDRALVQLDRAQCFIHDKDVLSAIDLTVAAHSTLESPQLQGLIAVRIQEVLELLPLEAQSKSAVLDLKEAIDSSRVEPIEGK